MKLIRSIFIGFIAAVIGYEMFDTSPRTRDDIKRSFMRMFIRNLSKFIGDILYYIITGEDREEPKYVNYEYRQRYRSDYSKD